MRHPRTAKVTEAMPGLGGTNSRMDQDGVRKVLTLTGHDCPSTTMATLK